MAVLGGDAFRVELDAMDREFLVAETLVLMVTVLQESNYVTALTQVLGK